MRLLHPLVRVASGTVAASLSPVRSMRSSVACFAKKPTVAPTAAAPSFGLTPVKPEIMAMLEVICNSDIDSLTTEARNLYDKESLLGQLQDPNPLVAIRTREWVKSWGNAESRQTLLGAVKLVADGTGLSVSYVLRHLWSHRQNHRLLSWSTQEFRLTISDAARWLRVSEQSLIKELWNSREFGYQAVEANLLEAQRRMTKWEDADRKPEVERAIRVLGEMVGSPELIRGSLWPNVSHEEDVEDRMLELLDPDFAQVLSYASRSMYKSKEAILRDLWDAITILEAFSIKKTILEKWMSDDMQQKISYASKVLREPKEVVACQVLGCSHTYSMVTWLGSDETKEALSQSTPEDRMLYEQTMSSTYRFQPQICNVLPNVLFRENLTSSAKNAASILGIPPSTLLQCLPSRAEYVGLLLEWKDVQRGRDLFIKGLGSFNVDDNFAKATQRTCFREYDQVLALYQNSVLRLMHEKLQPSARVPRKRSDLIDALRLTYPRDFIEAFTHSAQEHRSTKRKLYLKSALKESIYESDSRRKRTESDLERTTTDSLERVAIKASAALSPKDIQAEAYLDSVRVSITNEEIGNWRIIVEDTTCVTCQHLIRYHSGWLKPENLASLDEIVRVCYNRRSGRDYFWPDGWEEMPPERLLRTLREVERVKLYGTNVQYDHLKDLPDLGRLRVLRSKHEIHEVAVALRNCAVSYADSVERSQCVLVALMKEGTDRPEGLGMISLKPSLAKKDDWTQIYLSCNRRPPDSVRDLYHCYTTTIEDWQLAELEKKNLEEEKLEKERQF